MPKDIKSNIKKKSIGGKKYEIGAGGSRTNASSGSGSRTNSGAKVTSVVTKQGVRSVKAEVKGIKKVKASVAERTLARKRGKANKLQNKKLNKGKNTLYEGYMAPSGDVFTTGVRKTKLKPKNSRGFGGEENQYSSARTIESVKSQVRKNVIRKSPNKGNTIKDWSGVPNKKIGKNLRAKLRNMPPPF